MYVQLIDNNQLEAANKAVAMVGDEEYTRSPDIRRDFHHLQPLSDLHFDNRYNNTGGYTTSKTQLKVLSFIGLLILLIACFNFINLATAQASLRAKEIGVRKTITLVVTCLAGIYPAIVLSNYQPLEAIRSKVATQNFGVQSLSKSLVVLQFVIAQVLIIGALVIINQLDYIQTKDLGFEKDLIYTFPFKYDKETVAKQSALKQNLLQIPNVTSVSLNSDAPFSGNTWSSSFIFGDNPENANFSISQKFVDVDYMELYGIKLIAGKWLSASDISRQCVVNKITLDKLGITNPAEAIGQTINTGSAKLPIVGVMEDFHTKSLRKEHEPLYLTTGKKYYSQAAIKIRSTDIPKTIAAIEDAYDGVLPAQIFTGNFFDEDISRVYEKEAKLSTTCKIFGLLAILISCLGLFGLTTHAATQRVKEIGIRKVLGASIPNLIRLLSKDFLQLILIALLIAAPLAWYGMNQWLDNFVYRTTFHWSIFAIASVSTIFVAFLTVSYQAVRVAMANPIKALKME